MFFELLDADTDQGDIAYATGTDGQNRTYRHVVPDEPFHVTYLYVFQRLMAEAFPEIDGRSAPGRALVCRSL